MERLKGKRALITGGTTGIGFAAAEEFLREGARVIITGANPKNLDAARQKLGESVVAISADASSVAAQDAVAAAVKKEFSGLDVLFCNAGIVEMRPLEAWDEAAFDRSFNTNFKGAFFLIQKLLPLFANPASIVLNGSVNAHIGMPGSSIYSATKAATISLARTLSGELIGRGIRLNTISPGPIDTPLYGKLGLSQEGASRLQKQIPEGRFGNPKEVASAVVFFASDECSFSVGSELLITGGMGNI
ncbi:MAG TPA: SDR family oxidoreductase [Acidobacteriaceae bacterium]|nr:SDR family oxidoreductase [Acidobacteriaceae bacterium]